MTSSIGGPTQPTNQSFWDSLLTAASDSQSKVMDLFKDQFQKDILSNTTPSALVQKNASFGNLFSIGGLVDTGLTQLGIKPGEKGTREGLLSGAANWFEETSAGKWLTRSTATDGVASSAVTGSAVNSITNAQALTSAAMGAYDLVKNFGKMTAEHGVTTGAVTGASIGLMVGMPVLGGVIGAAAGGILSLFKKSGKPKEQKERDLMRKTLQKGGVIDDKFTIGLADGSRFDIGIDGKAKAEFGGRKPFEIDQQNPLAVSAYRVFAQFVKQVIGENQNLNSSLAGYLTNASLSNANGDKQKVLENMRAIIAQFSIAKSSTEQNQYSSNVTLAL